MQQFGRNSDKQTIKVILSLLKLPVAARKRKKMRENYTKSSKISNPLNQIELSILIFVWLDNHYLDDSKDYKGI